MGKQSAVTQNIKHTVGVKSVATGEVSPKPPAPKHTWVMLMLFIAPIVLFMGVMLAFYWPQMTARPQYDFVYATCSGGCDDEIIVTKEGKVAKAPKMPPAAKDAEVYVLQGGSGEVKFFRYSQQRQEPDELSMEEVNTLQLTTSRRSKDGYALVRHDGVDSGILFFYSHNSRQTGWTLQKGRIYKPVYLQGDVNSYYVRDILFVGWVGM